MSIDTRLALPVGFLLSVWERSLASVGRAASASAHLVAAVRGRLLRNTFEPPPSARREGIADVIVLSDGRKRER